jgi:dUTPase
MIHLPIKIEGPVEMPRYATDGSAAFDLYAPVSGFVYPGDAKKIPLDISEKNSIENFWLLLEIIDIYIL